MKYYYRVSFKFFNLKDGKIHKGSILYSSNNPMDEEGMKNRMKLILKLHPDTEIGVNYSKITKEEYLKNSKKNDT